VEDPSAINVHRNAQTGLRTTQIAANAKAFFANMNKKSAPEMATA